VSALYPDNDRANGIPISVRNLSARGGLDSCRVLTTSFNNQPPRNGVVTAVKTYLAPASSSRSASAAVAAEELQNWSHLGDQMEERLTLQQSTAKSSKLSGKPEPSAEQAAYMANLTALPLGHFLSQGGSMTHLSRASNKKSKKGGKRERSVALGNDERTPWTKIPMDRACHFTVTAGQIRATALLTQSTTLNTYGASQFTVSQLTEFASWSAVFDQYRILEIEAVLQFPMSENTGMGTDEGRYVSVIDTDDAAVPTDLDVLCAYSTAVESSCTQPHYHRWAPGVPVDLYTGAFGGFGTATSPWIDCGSSTVIHYGLKYGSTPGAGTGVLKMTYKFHVEFRATH